VKFNLLLPPTANPKYFKLTDYNKDSSLLPHKVVRLITQETENGSQRRGFESRKKFITNTHYIQS
jgi:hypothetical protein